MKTHTMPTGKKAFDAIRAKQKTIEARMYYPERREIQPGDQINLWCDEGGRPDDIVKIEVVKLVAAPTPEELIKLIDVRDTEYSDNESWVQAMRDFYPDADAMNKNGVVAMYFRHI